MSRGYFRRLAGLALGLPAALLAGCESDSATGPRIARVVVVSGHNQTGVVRTPLAQPLVVRVVDQADRPIAGAAVTWVVVSGGGVVTPSQTVTDANGQAEASFTLGNVTGSQAVRAELGAATPAVFSAFASPTPPAQLLISGGNNQTGTAGAPLATRLTVAVRDAFNDPKAGVSVTFTVVSGDGSLSSATAITDASGIAGTDWTLGPPAGAQSVSASVTGLPLVSFSAVANPGPAAALVILEGNNQAAPPGAALGTPLAVRVTDAFGNPVANATVSWVALAGSGSVNPAASSSDATGRATTSWTLGATGGAKTVRASVGQAQADFQATGTILFARAGAGSRHTCAVDMGGVLYCWGFNGDGQLGLGQAAQGAGPVFAGPVPASVTGALTFADVSGGGFHTCGWTLSANPYCWGKNVDGRVGDGGVAQVNQPTHVAGVNVFDRVGAGGTHTCALTLGGRLWCWGSNAEGQVGIVGQPVVPADSLAFPAPMPVAPALTWNAVAGGGLHACAVRADGSAWCWGNNASGQLGDGSLTNANMPVAVAGGLGFSTIVAGDRHTCGLTPAGAAWCWGNNTHGQLGDGSVASSAAPVAVAGGHTFTALAAGDTHTCGIDAGGAAWCWGRNANGQLGDGTLAGATTPVAVGGGLTFANLSAGTAHTCGVTTGQEAWCWGDNQYGQLGDGTQVQRTLPARVAFQ